MRLHTKLLLATLALVLLFVSGCSLGDPDIDNETGTVSIAFSDKNFLIQQVQAARSSINLAAKQITDSNLILALNNAALKGVTIKVVLDNDYYYTATGLYTNIQTKFGNSVADMSANFAIIDDSKAHFISTANTTNDNILYVTIKEEKLISNLKTEFNQMFDNERFGGSSSAKPKMELNQQKVFKIGNTTVGMYFLPQNDISTFVDARMYQSRYSVDVLAQYLDNSRLNQSFSDMIRNGVGRKFQFGSQSINSMTNYMNIFLTPGSSRLDQRVNCNAIIIDAGTSSSSLIFTTYPYKEESTLAQTDGICLIITGPVVDSFYNSMRTIYPAETGQQTIKIGSFNVQNFGTTTAARPDVMRMIATICTNFDVIAIQEFSDGTGVVAAQLSNTINGLNNGQYAYLNSGTIVDEQYVIYYKTSTIQLLAAPHIYTGGGITRSPYLAYFKAKNGTFDFVLGTVHTSPGSATTEIQRLTNVIAEAKTQFSENDVIIVGDYNADGSYFDASTYQTIFPTLSYKWVIPNGTDTTLSSSSFNAYDRIVHTASGNEDFAGQWGVFRFDEIFSFRSTTNTAAQVSDHYPIWAEYHINKDTD